MNNHEIYISEHLNKDTAGIPRYAFDSTAPYESIPFGLVDINEIFNSGKPLEKPHTHSFYQIVWYKEGSGSHFVDHKNEEIRPGRVFLISPGQIHNVGETIGGSGYVIHFNESFLSTENNNEEMVMKYNAFNTYDQPPYFDVDKKTSERLQRIVDGMIAQEELENTFGHTNYLSYLVKMFLITLIREGVRGNGDKLYTGNAASLNYIKFRRELEKNFRKVHTVKEYADLIGLSTKTLSNSVQQITDKNPLYIINERLTIEAKRMLLHSPLMIKEIANDLGFEDVSYFVKFFKRQTNILPSDFRERG